LIATIATESGGTLQEPSQDFSVAVTTNAPAIRRGRPRQSRKRVSEEGKGIRAGALGGTAQHFATQFPVKVEWSITSYPCVLPSAACRYGEQ
jgi:hypothetical protein